MQRVIQERGRGVHSVETIKKVPRESNGVESPKRSSDYAQEFNLIMTAEGIGGKERAKQAGGIDQRGKDFKEGSWPKKKGRGEVGRRRGAEGLQKVAECSRRLTSDAEKREKTEGYLMRCQNPKQQGVGKR